jgi:uncharacterized protein
MFPLGTVLLPGSVLPLHVFEDRYRHLVRACLEGDRCFGVALISQGHEVGGGEARTSVGVLARVLEAVEFEDGRWALHAVGVERFRVMRWLPDDPYPCAEIEFWEDLEAGAPSEDGVAAITDLIIEVASMAIALGEPVSALPATFPSEAGALSFALVAASPLGSADRFDLLCAEGPSRRMSLLEERLRDQRVLLGARLAMGGTDPSTA